MEQCLLFVQDGPQGLLLACDSGRKQRRAWGPGDRAPAVCMCVYRLYAYTASGIAE